MAPTRSSSNSKPQGPRPKRASIAKLMRTASVLTDRQQFAQDAGLSFPINKRDATSTFKRDLWGELGYVEKLEYKHYLGRYQRGDIAERIVEAYPRGTWSGGAELREDPDPKTDTPFEEAFKALSERLELWQKVLRADILSQLGEYSVILLGVAGEGPLAEELVSATGEDSILYLSPIGQGRAEVEKYVEDEKDPRYGLPETYMLKMGQRGTKSVKVHHSRVIHVAEGVLEDEVCGKPRLRSIWNRLDDLDKVMGGGAEAALKKMDPGLLLNIDPEAEIDADEESAMSDEIDEYVHGLRRVMQLRGVDVKQLQTQVASFGANADAIVKIISATTGIPLRILTGSERGELASTQDRGNWAERIYERRRDFAVPLVRRLVDRLIKLGALPEPEQYEVVWPEIEELNEDEKATVALKLAQANAAQKTAEGRVIVPSDEIRLTVFGRDPLDDVMDLPAEEGDSPRPEAGDEPPSPDAPPGEGGAPRAAARKTEVHRVAESFEDSFVSWLELFWDSIGESLAVESGLAAGNPEAVDAALGEALAEHVPVFTMDAAAEISKVLESAGSSVLESAQERGGFRSAALLDMAFDTRNQRAVNWAQIRAAALVTEILPETRAGVRELVRLGLDEGIPPKVLAQQVRSFVGLRSDQVQAVETLRQELLAAKGGTLVERFPPRDGLRGTAGFKARVPKGGATGEWVASKAERYATMQRNYRARLIARSETLRAANAGQKELWLQAREKGNLPKEAKRVLIATLDSRTRPAHAAAHGQVRGLTEPFDLGDAPEPGEAPLCRCTQGIASEEDIQRAEV